MTPLSVVCFKWKPSPGYRSTFTGAHVNTLRAMVARHYAAPHRFICCTDDPTGIDRDIEIVPLWTDLANIPNPHGRHNPSCYRRLKAFAPDFTAFGERFVSVDLDTVIVGDLRPLWDRPEDLVIWGETDPRSWYNGSMFLLTAGSRPQVWTKFHAYRSPRDAFRAGKFGSDQGWISYVLGKGEATWSKKQGVYSYRVHLRANGGALPDDARIVMFHGRVDPDSAEAQRLPWVREYYRGAEVAA